MADSAMLGGWAVAQADSTGIPSLNSRDTGTGGAASESGCSISTLMLYQGESQNLVHTQMWCSTTGGKKNVVSVPAHTVIR